MIGRRPLLGHAGIAALAATFPHPALTKGVAAAKDDARFRLVRVTGPDDVEFFDGARVVTVRRGGRCDRWTLVEIIAGDTPLIVLEDFADFESPMLLVGIEGVLHRFSKTAESTASDVLKDHLGYRWDQVAASPTDILGAAILARGGDPDYATVAKAFPPIRKIWGDTYNFLGTPDGMDKVWFQYGGRSPNFDPAVYHRPIEDVRKAGRVLDGLLGGYLPVLRFVYPESAGTYCEMLAFAPFRMVNDNARVQPVWYRVLRVENGNLAWVKYVDSYLPYPPRESDPPPGFYHDLIAMKGQWGAILAGGMQIDLPDARMANIAKHSLIRAMMGRSAGFPKYGAVDKNYGGSEHDGFPDTFTVETGAMLEWGLIARAGTYIDNYFGKFVRDDGVILYRGPETGQFGRMLTVVAQYLDYGGDPAIIKRHAKRIDAVADVLLQMRQKALGLPRNDPAFGMISGWSEADAVLEPDPQRYMQPYFSNSAEAARGFRDLGRAWQRIGFAERGQHLLTEAQSLAADLQQAITRSALSDEGKSIFPTIAGVKEMFHTALIRDRSDPQWRSYRAWMEMLHSGMLSTDQANSTIDYRGRHHDIMLGMPMAYGYRTGEMAGFLSYGHGYGLIRNDRIREALLMTYSSMAHQYTRGMWLAPETRRLQKDEWSAAYCGPSQLVAPLMLRWLAVFEDPQAECLWLGKGSPQDWLSNGQSVRVMQAPTRWGRVGFEVKVARARVTGQVHLPRATVETRLRLRRPQGLPIRSVMIDGQRWTDFNAASATITLPAAPGHTVSFTAQF